MVAKRHHRLPFFADLTSPTTPAVTAGLVGCVTPIAIGPMLSPLSSCRVNKRERVLEQRVAILKQRLAHALHEVEALKSRMRADSDAGTVDARLAVTPSEEALGADLPVPVAAGLPAGHGAAVDAGANPLQPHAGVRLATTGAPGAEAARPLRKRGGRGRGGKGKKEGENMADL